MPSTQEPQVGQVWKDGDIRVREGKEAKERLVRILLISNEDTDNVDSPVITCRTISEEPEADAWLSRSRTTKVRLHRFKQKFTFVSAK